MAPRRTAPPTFEALVHDYDHFLDVIIQRIGRGGVCAGEIPDLKQAVYLRMLKYDSLARYDPARGAFSTYLQLITRSVLCNHFAAHVHDPLRSAKGLLEDRDERRYRRTVVAETVPALRDDAAIPRGETQELLARFRAVAQQAEDGARLLQVFEACYRGDWKPRQAAITLHLPVKRVQADWSRIQAILARLQGRVA